MVFQNLSRQLYTRVRFPLCTIFIFLCCICPTHSLEFEDDRQCLCANHILLNTIPAGTQYLKPITASETCARRQVLAVLKDKSTKCLNPHAPAVRHEFNRLFFRVVFDAEQEVYTVIDTGIQFLGWPVPHAYKTYLWKRVITLNRIKYGLRMF
ncbi:chemokine vCXCL2 [Panine betaherpesvirus 2]|uniref:Chemokine vCXCL2 n=1 Tax=Panine betaherpesvirus 2 TaxID=188763 RepID=Q8QRX8_9BETA|nr:chemokine vCXCL2 [Panine betaherpesvirus 2]AAM00761.1 chemokine vCXCL2 [Panine betaherpesvirus 2]QXV67873.1 chemokine vCXCL2 [Panine betaherpesvirus 2]